MFTASKSIFVHTTIALSIAGGLVITVLGYFYAPWMLKLLGTPDEILSLAISYTRIFFLGILPTIIYNMGAGILLSMKISLFARTTSAP